MFVFGADTTLLHRIRQVPVRWHLSLVLDTQPLDFLFGCIISGAMENSVQS